MKNSFFALFLLLSATLLAQHSISGTFTPAKDYTWIIAYRLQPGTQAYIADTAVKNGKFTMQIPAEASSGTYRMVYGVPEEEFYFDVIYDGKENIQLDFDAEKGISFRTSEENQIFNSYFREINSIKQKFIDFYTAGKTDKVAYKRMSENLQATQNAYEDSTQGMMIHQFIKANRPYIPSAYETSEVYWQHKKDDFFKHLDANNTELQASGFLTDRLTNYVFTPVSTARTTKATTEKMLQDNIKIVDQNLKDTDANFRLHVFQSLWNIAESNEFSETANFIYQSYLKDLAKATGNEKIVAEIEVKNRLRIGAKAPEIIWKEGNTTKSLSGMDGADCYILVFWSSTCSHCLNELPELHKKLANYPSVKVLAIGLEDDTTTWKPESAKLNQFEHALALGRWDSEYAHLYDIHKTPTYFILDKNKRILATPESDKEVIDYLNN